MQKVIKYLIFSLLFFGLSDGFAQDLKTSITKNKELDSLRKKDEINDYHSLITIEVNHDEITQMRGLKNRKSNAIEKLIIKEWAYKNQLKIV